jgi:GAF domain/ANTAR domain
VTTEAAARLAVAFARGMSRSPVSGWCDVCAEFLTVAGAGITIMGAGVSGPMCASSATVGTLEESQFTVGEGPCPDAFRTGRSVHEPLLDMAAFGRWPTFASLATEHGIRAVFAYPLMSNGAKVGVLSLYQTAPGALTAGQHADSLAAVRVLTETVLSLQDEAPSGSLAAEIDDVVGYRTEIYQASGIVAVQLGITADDALLRLRAHAFASEQTLDAVASAIVLGQLRLDDDDDDDVSQERPER